MRPYFKPLLVPTLWLIPLLAILIGLGTWQIERLHWKEGLLAKIHTGLTAAPMPLRDALPATDPGHIAAADYRRVTVRGLFENGEEILFFTTGPGGAPVYHVLTPFLMDDGHTLLVDRGWVPTDLPPSLWHRGDLNGPRNVVGIIRQPAPPNWFTPPIDKAKRIVHTRDPQTLAKAFGLKNIFPMFLEADATPNPGGWPKGGVTVVDLPNDHLQYAITWFGLALGLLGVYLSYHASKGRLGLR
ncbi:MAG TPA: SURF1 family protein [Rhizomicrobium sp.]|jgi:surfeit locus 1 family protein